MSGTKGLTPLSLAAWAAGFTGTTGTTRAKTSRKQRGKDAAMTDSTAAQGDLCRVCQRRTWAIWFLLSVSLLLSSAAVFVLALSLH